MSILKPSPRWTDWLIGDPRELELGGYSGVPRSTSPWKSGWDYCGTGTQNHGKSFRPPAAGWDRIVRSDQDTSLHVEAFYSLQVSENLTITPGLIWLTAPNHNANNDDALIGVVRTTFSF